MKATRITSKEFSEKVFCQKNSFPKYSFYLEQTKSGDYQWGYELGVIEFADSILVIANYCGGGSPFCYDLTDDTDSSGLFECFDTWLRDVSSDEFNGDQVIYIES